MSQCDYPMCKEELTELEFVYCAEHVVLIFMSSAYRDSRCNTRGCIRERTTNSSCRLCHLCISKKSNGKL